MRRFFRLVFKLSLLAAIGVGVAVAVKKFTAPPPLPDELEPWPPLSPDPVKTAVADAVDEATSVAEDLAAESSNGSASDSEESSASSN